ncbi:hypothetical protein E4U43_008366 [Claviceps pusilla]|uniref:Uncharacterized protein n=1 Tax=Claviceps pusilla TaxID=123648 RepID=A0A9P7NDB2_9HYPO|nr:hypothetical protein E4U43_008366 [Claviceps pusilla]
MLGGREGDFGSGSRWEGEEEDEDDDDDDDDDECCGDDSDDEEGEDGEGGGEATESGELSPRLRGCSEGEGQWMGLVAAQSGGDDVADMEAGAAAPPPAAARPGDDRHDSEVGDSGGESASGDGSRDRDGDGGHRSAAAAPDLYTCADHVQCGNEPHVVTVATTAAAAAAAAAAASSQSAAPDEYDWLRRRTMSSSEGRALSRGRSPSCMHRMVGE